MTWADLHEYAAFNRNFLAAVRAGHEAGQTVDQIAGGWTMPAGYAGYRTPQPAGLGRRYSSHGCCARLPPRGGAGGHAVDELEGGGAR